MDPAESEWDDIFVPTTLDFEGNTQEVKKIATHLRQAFPDDEIKVELGFETYDMMKKFEKKLQTEYDIYHPENDIVEKNDWDNLWREIFLKSLKKKSSETDKLKMFKVNFSNPLQLIVFYINYEKKIQRLEAQYSYIILPYRKKLMVYLKDPYEHKINSFFITELFEMKNKLIIRVETDIEIYNKARFSKIAVQMLEKSKIKTMVINRFSSAVFFSEEYASVYEMKKEIRRLLSYHVSVIKFPETFVDTYILQEIMKLIYFEIKPALKEIQRYYDMPVEVDIEKAAIVITDFHEVFTDGVELVKQTLAKLKIIEIECDYLVDLKKIMQKAQYLSLVKFNYRYRKCFLLFSDPVTEKHSKIIEKFFTQISTVFRGRYRLVIHFVHLYQDQQKLMSETKRARAIGAEYQLNCTVHNTFFHYRNCDKVVFEPVELSIYASQLREKQVKMFLRDFITNKTAIKKDLRYDLFEAEIALDESVFQEYVEGQSMISTTGKIPHSKKKALDQNEDNKENMYEDVKNLASTSTSDSSGSASSQCLELNIPFEYPLMQDFPGDEPIKRGKRQRELENLMETQYQRKLMIWKVIIYFSVEMPGINSHDRIELIVPDFFEKKNFFYKLKKYTDVESKKVKDFEPGQKGYISLINLKKNAFVPVYEVQFVA